LMKRMLQSDPEHTKLFVIYHNKIPVACSLVSGLNQTLVNPWASFKRTYQKIAPNMLLYWEMLNYAIANGYKVFDFGRSTPNEGTYKFKEQWGAVPEQLFWYTYGKKGTQESESISENKKEKFISVWRKLPLSLTKFCGPILRRHIHL
jgi:serine/alanine adding enzyme